MNCVAETVTKMIESLPEHLQKKLLDEITPIISEALDEAKWEDQFQRSSSRLVGIASEVRERIQKGNFDPLDFSKL
jgi:NTP pyrophosphatase (non-canonical NTP hydrolase)